MCRWTRRRGRGRIAALASRVGVSECACGRLEVECDGRLSDHPPGRQCHWPCPAGGIGQHAASWGCAATGLGTGGGPALSAPASTWQHGHPARARRRELGRSCAGWASLMANPTRKPLLMPTRPKRPALARPDQGCSGLSAGSTRAQAAKQNWDLAPDNDRDARSSSGRPPTDTP